MAASTNERRKPRDLLPEPARRELERVVPSSARPTLPFEARRADADYGRPASPDWREIDWREHRREARVGGRRMNYVDIGSGDPPVVLIHGLGGNWQNWLENIPCAAQRHRVIAMDLPGFGESEMPEGEISISGYATAVAELLEQLGVEKAIVVGNSMGGFIAAELTISYPERVAALVLAAAAGITATNVRRNPLMTVVRACSAIASWVAANHRAVAARARARHLATAFVFRHPSRLPPDLMAELMRGAGKPAFFPGLEANLNYDFRDRLPEIGCPTLIVWGAEDVIIPTKDADEFNRHIAHAEKVVFDDTGHCPMIERPREFNECLVGFLERVEAGEAPAGEGAAGEAGSSPERSTAGDGRPATDAAPEAA